LERGSSCWQQDRHHGRRTVWPLLRLTQNPAGFCWQGVQSWTVCGSRQGAGIVRRRGIVVVRADQFWPVATLAAEAADTVHDDLLVVWAGRWQTVGAVSTVGGGGGVHHT
jgi:hypothetical protein